MNTMMEASGLATPSHRVVLVDVGPQPELVADKLRELGCPADAAEAFIVAAKEGQRPEIMYGVPVDEARAVTSTLGQAGAVVLVSPEPADGDGVPSSPTDHPVDDDHAGAAPADPMPQTSATVFDPAPAAELDPPTAHVATGSWPAGAAQSEPPSTAPQLHPSPTTDRELPDDRASSAPSNVAPVAIQRYLDAYNAGDVAAIRRSFAEDAVFDDSSGVILARGRDAIGSMFEGLIHQMPQRTVTVVSRLTADPWVVDNQLADLPGHDPQYSVTAYLVDSGLIRRVHILRS